MTLPFALRPDERQATLDRARANPLDPASLEPGAFEGAYKAGLGIPLAGAKAAGLVGTALEGMAALYGEPDDPELRFMQQGLRAAAKRARETAQDWVKAVTPDPRTTGVVGQMGAGVVSILGEVAVLTPYGAAAVEANQVGVDLVEQGADVTTAAGAAALTGASVLAGGLTAKYFATARSSVLGAGAVAGLENVVINGLARGGTGEWLRARGYGEMAEQYRLLDQNAAFADLALGVLLGSGFKGAERVLAARAAARAPARAPEAGAPAADAPSAAALDPAAELSALMNGADPMDAALVAQNAAHLEVGTAPGVPASPETRALHVQTVEKAIESILVDEPVVVPPELEAAPFVDGPPDPVQPLVLETVREVLGDEAYAQLAGELAARGLPTDGLDNSGVLQVRAPSPDVPVVVRVGTGYEPITWDVVDAAEVSASLTKGANQFRDRTRAASEAQINRIAAAPDWALLNEAPLMDFGAPTLTADGQIVGGNGRFEGVSRAYDSGTAAAYRAQLEANAARFGVDPATVAGMRKPVLVRRFTRPVDVQRMALASNEGAGLRMSALEQAKVDGTRLGSLDALTIPETGDLATAQNVGFVRQWVSQFPQTEQAALADANGRLSQEGATRLRNAVMFRAYGDSPTLARLIESTDPGSRNVAAALLRAAGKIAAVRDGIGGGRLYPLDITADLTAAVEVLARLRDEGTTVADYLGQADMFGGELTIEARTILQYLDENIRSARTIGEMLTAYVDQVLAAGDPRQADMFGEAQMPERLALLERAIERTGKAPAGDQADFFGTQEPAPAAPMGETAAAADAAAVDPAVAPILRDNPGLTVVGDDGQPVLAADAIDAATQAEQQAAQDAPGFMAAVQCEFRG